MNLKEKTIMEKVYLVSKWEELTDKEYEDLYNIYYLRKECDDIMYIYESYPELKDMSIKQLVNAKANSKDFDTKLRINQEISYRFFVNSINYYSDLFYNGLTPYPKKEETKSPLDNKELKDIVQLFLSPTFQFLKDHQKRKVYQALHNKICEIHKVAPATIHFQLQKKDIEDSVFMQYVINCEDLSASIQVPNQTGLVANSNIHNNRGNYAYLFHLNSIIHETKHHINAMKSKYRTSYEAIIDCCTTRNYCVPFVKTRMVHHDIAFDPDEIDARCFTVNTLEKWIKSGILPQNDVTDLLMFEVLLECYSYFLECGRNPKEFRQNLENYLNQQTKDYRSINNVLTYLDETFDIEKHLTNYLDVAEDKYKEMTNKFKVALVKLYNKTKKFCEENNEFYKRIFRKYVATFDFEGRFNPNIYHCKLNENTFNQIDNLFFTAILVQEHYDDEHSEELKENPIHQYVKNNIENMILEKS